MNSIRVYTSKMQLGATKACRMMKLLSNRDRLLLLCQLSQGEKRMGELDEILCITQPTLSQQLTVLVFVNVYGPVLALASCIRA
jgi:DNA-binding HxlR family transcriptional regulator